MSRHGPKSKNRASQSLSSRQYTMDNQANKTLQTPSETKAKPLVNNSNSAPAVLNDQLSDSFHDCSKTVKKKAPRKKRAASTSPKTGLNSPDQDNCKELRLKPPPLLTPDLSLEAQDSTPRKTTTTKNGRDSTTSSPAQRCKNATPAFASVTQDINNHKDQAIDLSPNQLYKLGPRKRTPTLKAREAAGLVPIASSPVSRQQNQIAPKIVLPSQRAPEHNVTRPIARITTNKQTQSRTPISLPKRPAPRPPQHIAPAATVKSNSLPPNQFQKTSKFGGFHRNKPISPKSLLKPESARFRPGVLSAPSFPSPVSIPLPISLRKNQMSPLSGFVRTPEPTFLSRPIVPKKMPAPGTITAQRGTTKKYGKTVTLEMAPLPHGTSTENGSTPLTFITPSTQVSATIASKKKPSKGKKQTNASLQQPQTQTTPTGVLGGTKSKVTKIEIPSQLPLTGNLSTKSVSGVKPKSKRAKAGLPSLSSTSSKHDNSSKNRHKVSSGGKKVPPTALSTVSVQEQQAKHVRNAVAQAQQDALTSKVARLYPRMREPATITSGSSLDDDEEADEMRDQFSLLRGATSSRKLELAEKLRKNLKQRMLLDKASSTNYLEDSDKESSKNTTVEPLENMGDYKAVGPLMVQTFEVEDPWFYVPHVDDWDNEEEEEPMRLSREVIDMMHDRFDSHFMAQIERAYAEQCPFDTAEQTMHSHDIKRVEGQSVTENGHAGAKGYLYDSLGCFLKGVEVGPVDNGREYHHVRVHFAAAGNSRTEGSRTTPAQLTPQHLHNLDQNSEWITGWSLLTEFYGSFFLNCVGHPKWPLIVAQIKRQQRHSAKHSSTKHNQEDVSSLNHKQQKQKQELTPYGLITLFSALHLFNDTPALRNAEWTDFRDIFPSSFVYEWLKPRSLRRRHRSDGEDGSGSAESGSSGEGDEEEATASGSAGGCGGSSKGVVPAGAVGVGGPEKGDLYSPGNRKQLKRKKAMARQVVPWKYKLVWQHQQPRGEEGDSVSEKNSELVLMMCF